MILWEQVKLTVVVGFSEQNLKKKLEEQWDLRL